MSQLRLGGWAFLFLLCTYLVLDLRQDVVVLVLHHGDALDLDPVLPQAPGGVERVGVGGLALQDLVPDDDEARRLGVLRLQA